MRLYTGFLTTALIANIDGILCQDDYYYQYEEPLSMAAETSVADGAMDGAWVDFGPDNRKRGNEEEKGGNE